MTNYPTEFILPLIKKSKNKRYREEAVTIFSFLLVLVSSKTKKERKK